MAVLDLVIGRQPIFDREHRVVGDKLVYCNAGTGLLTGDVPILLPPDRTVLEVLETVEPTDEVVEGCRRLVRQGYRIALDDFVFVEGIEPLLELSSVVKVDIRLVAGRTLDSSSLARLQLAARLLEGERDLAEVERIVRAEPAMAYQLLQLSGLGASGGLRRTVSTLREALVLLGWRKLQSWVAYLLVSMRGTTSEEDVVTALSRARMCELLAAEVDPALAGAAFAAGMLSALDLLLDVPLSEALASVSIDEELRSAILTGEGPLGRLLADVVDHRLGSSVVTPRSGVDRHRLDVTGMAALTWAVEVARGALAPPPEGDARAVP
jgi:EAL and modified HD-GYP domain-containing signal transduction protein